MCKEETKSKEKVANTEGKWHCDTTFTVMMNGVSASLITRHDIKIHQNTTRIIQSPSLRSTQRYPKHPKAQKNMPNFAEPCESLKSSNVLLWYSSIQLHAALRARPPHQTPGAWMNMKWWLATTVRMIVSRKRGADDQKLAPANFKLRASFFLFPLCLLGMQSCWQAARDLYKSCWQDPGWHQVCLETIYKILQIYKHYVSLAIICKPITLQTPAESCQQ